MNPRRFLLPPALGLVLFAGGIEGFAQQPVRPGVVQAPEGGNAPPAGDQGNAEARAEATPPASAFEIRYIIAYVLMLVFIGGSTVLIIRPSGRAIQGGSGPATGKAKK
jgi:hypothetical protein